MGSLMEMIRASTGVDEPVALPMRTDEPSVVPADAATPLDRARAALAETNARLATLAQDRRARLLADDDAAVAEIDREVETLNRSARLLTDKLAVLEEDAQRQGAERRAAEREARLAAADAKFAEGDRIGEELEASIARTVELFKQLIAVRTEAFTASGLALGDAGVALASGPAIKIAVAHQLYKVGTTPMLHGRAGEIVPTAFPGGQAPTIEMRGLPERIVPLSELLRTASAWASDRMRGRSPAVPAAAHVVATSASAIESIQSLTEPVRAQPRSEAEQRLAGLLSQMARLAMAPNSDEEYADVVRQVAATQGEIAASQSNGATHP